MFAWYAWGTGGMAAAAGPVPVDSPLVYRPDRRKELWRFLTYSVVHAGWLHLAFNLLVQLAVSFTFLNRSTRLVYQSIWRVLGCLIGWFWADTKVHKIVPP